MNDRLFDRPRFLITEKRYAEARELLQKIDHPTAKKWLAKLDEIAPEPPATPSVETVTPVVEQAPTLEENTLSTSEPIAPSVRTSERSDIPVHQQPPPQVSFAHAGYQREEVEFAQRNGKDIHAGKQPPLALVGSVAGSSRSMLLVVGAVALIVIFFASFRLAPSSDEEERLPVSWEYLLMNYSQSPSYDQDENPLELVSFDRSEYSQEFGTRCDSVDFDCLQRNYRGMSHFLGVLGRDGWEVVSVIDKSNQAMYRVELILKRQA